MLIIGFGFGMSVKQGSMLGAQETDRKLLCITLPFIKIYWLNKQATAYWYECARGAFNDPSWFVENHHAVRQAKRKATLTWMKAYQSAWEEHRNRYQEEVNKCQSENDNLRQKLGEARRDIEAYKRLVNGGAHE